MSQELLSGPTINLSEIVDRHQDFSYDQLATIHSKCQEQLGTLASLLQWHGQVDQAFRVVQLSLDESQIESIKRLFYLSVFSKKPNGYQQPPSSHFQFGEFEFRFEGTTPTDFQLQVYEYDLYGWTNLWPLTEDISRNVAKTRCQGCQDKESPTTEGVLGDTSVPQLIDNASVMKTHC